MTFPVLQYIYPRQSQDHAQQEGVEELGQIPVKQAEAESGEYNGGLFTVVPGPVKHKLAENQFFQNRGDEHCNHYSDRKTCGYHRTDRFQLLASACRSSLADCQAEQVERGGNGIHHHKNLEHAFEIQGFVLPAGFRNCTDDQPEHQQKAHVGQLGQKKRHGRPEGADQGVKPNFQHQRSKHEPAENEDDSISADQGKSYTGKRLS